MVGAAVFLVAVVLGSLLYFYPQAFSGLEQNTWISVSQTFVDPQGSEVAGEWRGSYWNLVAAVTQVNDDIAGVVLPDDYEGEVTVGGVTTALKTGAKVEVKLDPQEPYLVRNLVEKTVMVAPVAVGGGVTKDAFWLNYYDWAEPSFRVYTPYVVSVYKDDVLVGQKTLNAEGESSVQTIPTSEGNVRVENLGVLGGTYLSPNTPSQIAILKGYPCFYDWAQISSRVDGSTAGSVAGAGASKYADYWYGISRNSANQAVNPVVVIGMSTTNTYRPSAFGGWSGSDYGGNAQPVKPVVSASDKSGLPVSEQSFSSLTEFLEGKNVANLAATLFSKYSKVEMVSEGGNLALKLTVPWSAYATPLVNVKVPSELADTWVERPAISNVKPVVSWEATGGKNYAITGNARLLVSLKQYSTVASSTRVVAQCGNARVGIYPTEYPSVGLEPQETKVVSFDITNLGVLTEEANVPVTVVCYEKWSGAETGRDVAYVTLLPTLAHDVTTLNVHVVEKGGLSKPVVGLPLNVVYADQTKSGFTDGSGVFSVGLETAGGGGFSGPVTISSPVTEKYNAATRTVTVAPGANDVTFEVSLLGSPIEEDWMFYVIVAVAVFAVVASIGVAAYAARSRKRKYRYR